MAQVTYAADIPYKDLQAAERNARRDADEPWSAARQPPAVTVMRSRTGSSIFPDVLPSYTEEPPTENRVGRSPSIVFESIFNIAMFVSVFSGISIGFMVRYLSNKPWTARQVMYLAFPGELLKRMLRETVLPLGVSSVVAAMGSMELSLSLRVLRRALVYALLAKLSALDAITAMSFPNTTGVHGEGPSRIVNDSAGILLFCALLGAVLSGNEGGVLLGFFIGLSNAMMLIAHLVLIYSPFGVFFLTVAYIVDIEDLSVGSSAHARYSAPCGDGSQ
ncbi:hypothetical protein HPB48_002001 [Haemaphysalis longicornis]|uniref:Amino acid transporter n=1 Tax=Haemaphysalis longicornis TaxID=44386 RepID=A0A9J6FIV8_HAELO|nr:hypothetical protein HPB48_002001 [Haemaphysalis longicornis]